MKPESVKQMKKFLDARDLLLNARDQYETSISALKSALVCADLAMTEYRDDEATRQIVVMREVVAGLPRTALDSIDAIAETLEALATEVTAHEEHLPAGVS